MTNLILSRFVTIAGLLKVAELLKVKGLVEEEREKLLGTKDHRPSSSAGAAAAAAAAAAVDDHDREHRPRSSSASSSTKVNGDSASTTSPPSTSAASGPGGMVRPFIYTPPAGGAGPQFPMWPLPGIFPGAHNLFNRGGDLERAAAAASSAAPSSSTGEGGSSAADKEGDSPVTGKEAPGSGPSAAKRKKTASGSNGSSSSKESGLGSLPPIIPGAAALPLPLGDRKLDQDDRIHSAGADGEGKDSNGPLPSPGSLDKAGAAAAAAAAAAAGAGIANYVPNQRLEWKRYKQYTRNDIMAAIEEVRKGMSALQASRKYGVPSRTLYDKVKKMGITTGRQMQRKSLPQYPASFPSLGGVSTLRFYPRFSPSIPTITFNLLTVVCYVRSFVHAGNRGVGGAVKQLLHGGDIAQNSFIFADKTPVVCRAGRRDTLKPSSRRGPLAAAAAR